MWPQFSMRPSASRCTASGRSGGLTLRRPAAVLTASTPIPSAPPAAMPAMAATLRPTATLTETAVLSEPTP